MFDQLINRKQVRCFSLRGNMNTNNRWDTTHCPCRWPWRRVWPPGRSRTGRWTWVRGRARPPRSSHPRSYQTAWTTPACLETWKHGSNSLNNARVSGKWKHGSNSLNNARVSGMWKLGSNSLKTPACLENGNTVEIAHVQRPRFLESGNTVETDWTTPACLKTRKHGSNSLNNAHVSGNRKTRSNSLNNARVYGNIESRFNQLEQRPRVCKQGNTVQTAWTTLACLETWKHGSLPCLYTIWSIFKHLWFYCTLWNPCILFVDVM